MKKLILSVLLALSICIHATPQTKPQPAPEPWWKHAVIYEIYPRSFQDTNGDGMGDLNGITSRLDYLKDLGIDAIWITPFYPSPQVDYGYDIADYVSIDPEYGTMADFDRLVSEAKKRNIRVILDYVMNHTSDQHPWFKASRSSRDNPKRNWYVWRDGRNGGPPNNWLSWFGGPAWTLDSNTNQYYYHYFYVEQPDLNWRNPEVKKAMFDVVRFWLDKGVAGFRIDAVSRLYEDPAFRDEPVLPGRNAYGDPNIKRIYTDNLPEVHDALRELRALVDKYPGHPVLIGEADQPNITELTRMYGAKLDEIQLPMDFQIAILNQLSAPKFRKLLDEVQNNPAGGQPHYFFSNHDQPRQWDRYGDGKNNDQIAKLLAALLLMPRATPQMYYGEEIGMRTTPPARVEDVRDPIGKKGWPEEKGRDGERTPMQWDASRNAGFTTGPKTWLWIPPSASTYNVATQSKDPNSILNFYKGLIALRRNNPIIRDGNYVTVNPDDPNVLSFLRKTGTQCVLVALNMSAQRRSSKYDLSRQCANKTTARTLLTSPTSPAKTAKPKIKLENVAIPAYGVLIAQVE
jgi:alpha-glucosidase